MKSDKLIGQEDQARKNAIERKEKREAKNGFIRNCLFAVLFIVLAVVLPIVRWHVVHEKGIILVLLIAALEFIFIGMAILMWRCANTWRK
tara:strand:- start:1139 stop:1408 length:270 start_codon:yes stop_codon:yes gene_type:complete